MSFKPFVTHVELPEDVRRELHRSQIFLSLSPGNDSLLRVAIVPAEERFSGNVAAGEVSPGGGGPVEIGWLPTACP